MDMRRLILAVGGAMLLGLMAVATVLAAGPNGQGAAGPNGQGAAGQGTIIPSVLGLTQAQIQEQRQDGKSLAQIAQQQGVDPQKVVDALTTRYAERIQERVENGGLTAAEATELKAQVELRAKDMVNKTTLGGMQGVAVGAGPANGNGNGNGAGNAGNGGNGTGTCDGTGPHGNGQP
jgi:hypothetical protein